MQYFIALVLCTTLLILPSCDSFAGPEVTDSQNFTPNLEQRNSCSVSFNYDAHVTSMGSTRWIQIHADDIIPPDGATVDTTGGGQWVNLVTNLTGTWEGQLNTNNSRQLRLRVVARSDRYIHGNNISLGGLIPTLMDKAAHTAVAVVVPNNPGHHDLLYRRVPVPFHPPIVIGMYWRVHLHWNVPILVGEQAGSLVYQIKTGEVVRDVDAAFQMSISC